MSKLRLSNGADYATPNSLVFLLGSLTSAEVLETLTEENLSEIQYLADRGAVTGTYYNKLLCSYVENGSTYRSLIDNNIWAPNANPAGWEAV